jgi:tetratricopeptide (TPR) repeat protein
VPPCLTESQALWETLVAASPGSAAYRDGLATCHHVHGNYFFERGCAAESARHFRATIDLRERLLAEQPRSRDFCRRLAGTLLNLSVLLQQDPAGAAEAQACHDRAEAFFEQLLRDDPDEWETVSSLAIMRMNWAYVLANTGRTDAALADLAKSVPVLDAVLKREPNANAAQNALFRTHGTRAVLLGGVGRHAEAAAAWEQVVAVAPPAERNACLWSFTESLARAGDYGRAIPTAEEAIAGLPAKAEVDQFGPPAGVCALILTRLAADRTLPAVGRDRCSARAAAAGVGLLRKARSSLSAGQWQRFRTELAETDGLSPLRDLPECRLLLQTD